ncbi:protein giant [Eurosta solidaginis]|uniref:protein giant n=1 Tax=Eurosta solidaginis TaxID=178769 RepID=UPI0035309020
MLVHDKQAAARQFLLDMKSGPTNLIHSASNQHARFTHHSIPYQHQTYPLNSHSLSQHMPSAIEQLELYSAYAYQHQQQQQQKQQQQTLMIGNDKNTECTKRRQLASEVLDLSRRDSVETTRKTPSPYNTNSSFSVESTAESPAEHQQQHSSPSYDGGELAGHSPSLYTAQTQLSRLAPPLASFYPALYTSFGHLTKDGNANPAFNGTRSPPMAPLASALTPPASTTSTQRTSPITNTLTVANAVVAAAAAAVTVTPSNAMLHNIKTEDTEMTPISPSSSYDGRRSRSPNRQQPLANNNPSTPNSAGGNCNGSVHTVKSTRPFKAFPRDPLVIAANFAATDVLLDNPRVERYTEYRKRVLEQIRSCNGGSRTVTNPKMRRLNSRRNSNTSSNAPDCGGSSEGEERHLAVGVDESSDCDSSYAGGDKVSSSAHGGEDSNNNQTKLHKLTSHSSHGGQMKDAAYYERRRKNNAAAKKSRDRRRIKEDEIAIRAAYLERQNIELLCQIDALKAQLAVFTSKVASA